MRFESMQGMPTLRRWAAVIALLAMSSLAMAGQAAEPQKAKYRGEVLEVKEVDPYTYLRLKTAEGEIWAAVTRAPVKKGATVTIENAIVMNQFESKALKRKFDRIVFGSLGGAGGAAADRAQPHGSAAKASVITDVSVPKAQGPDARTVAELFGKKSALKDKAAVVRGKVVKVTQNVMGKNWVHLRDGTGSAADHTNDLLVTTKELAQVGAVVVAKGTVRTEVTLGAGYTYPLLLEDATLQK